MPHGHVILLQRQNGFAHGRIALFQQQREDMCLFVQMVQGRRQIKITQHISGRGAALCIMPLGCNVRHQLAQQRQAASHPVVTCFEHLERLLETDGR